MRDLLFKNLTSDDKKRKIIASSEIVDKQGVRSIIRRHFVCIVRDLNANFFNQNELEDDKMQKPLPSLYILKEHNNLEQRETFFCRIKGSIFATVKGRLYLILYCHSLKISLTATSAELMKYNEEDNIS